VIPKTYSQTSEGLNFITSDFTAGIPSRDVLGNEQQADKAMNLGSSEHMKFRSSELHPRPETTGPRPQSSEVPKFITSDVHIFRTLVATSSALQPWSKDMKFQTYELHIFRHSELHSPLTNKPPKVGSSEHMKFRTSHVHKFTPLSNDLSLTIKGTKDMNFRHSELHTFRSPKSQPVLARAFLQSSSSKLLKFIPSEVRIFRTFANSASSRPTNYDGMNFRCSALHTFGTSYLQNFRDLSVETGGRVDFSSCDKTRSSLFRTHELWSARGHTVQLAAVLCVARVNCQC
jgi:hypothetical protein